MMFKATDSVHSAIQEQAKLIKNKRDNGTGRSKEANVDEEDLESHYRRIAALFRQLQVSSLLVTFNCLVT